MIICGVKVSHDASVAVIEDGRLRFSVEVEKVANAHRYSSLGALERVAEILRTQGVDPDDVDQFVVDGWWPEGRGDAPAVLTTVGGQPLELPVAQYAEDATAPDVLHRSTFGGYAFSGRTRGYASYHHTTDHVFSAYCTSPFAVRDEDALVVVWDGAISPRAYLVRPKDFSVRSLGPLMWITGNIFADFCSHFEPFYSPTYEDITDRHDEANLLHHLGIAGKAMAYAALGTVDPATFEYFDDFFDSLDAISRSDAFLLGKKVLADRDHLFQHLSNADLIASFQEYLGKLLRDRLAGFAARTAGGPQNLVLSGGCALNIKWNGMIRESGAFREIWIPPFPNDAGVAIGAACSEMFRTRESAALAWDVYSGPALAEGPVPAGWTASACDEREVARILHEEAEPVVVLSGRAELGPRALGNRSILAPAVSPAMKDHLNEIKNRAAYRPVAPICLEDHAHEIFTPGGADPYMLFDHVVRPAWRDRIPAVLHLDGTARLQTVGAGSTSRVAGILGEYYARSGIPVLCNTSANFNGCGFFPDVASAAQWGRTKYIWSEGVLYTKEAEDAERVFPASFQQTRLWLREAAFVEAGSLNPSVMRRFSEVDGEALAAALSALLARHEALRTTFADRDGQVVQVVRPATAIDLPIETVPGDTADDVRTHLDAIVQQEVQKPFDLTTGPIMRPRLFRAGDDYVLLVVIHHIAFDRWSHGVFESDLAELYRAYRAGAEPKLPALEFQYKDYAAWQLDQWQSGALARDAAWWQQEMARRPDAWALPGGSPRTGSGPSRAATLGINLPKDVADDVVAFAKQVRASVSVVLLAVFDIALARWTGRDHVLVGTPVANRPKPETERLVGLFVNMVPLSARIVAGESFRQFVQRVRGDVFDAYDHQDVFFNHIVESVPESERGTLISAVFAYDDATTNLWQTEDFGEPAFSGLEGPVQYDLALIIQRMPAGIVGGVDYPGDRFEPAAMQTFADDFTGLLERLVRDPDQLVPTKGTDA